MLGTALRILGSGLGLPSVCLLYRLGVKHEPKFTVIGGFGRLGGVKHEPKFTVIRVLGI